MTEILTRMLGHIDDITQNRVTRYLQSLLGAFAKLRKAIISFVISVRPSVCQHVTARLPLDGFMKFNLLASEFYI
jgi:hypothetical protein